MSHHNITPNIIIMNKMKKYVAPSAETIKVDLVDMCCTSISDKEADPDKEVMTKEAELFFDEEEEI